ncbi:MAG TPA: beta-galactosidase [Bryobacteraceae bacterium]
MNRIPALFLLAASVAMTAPGAEAPAPRPADFFPMAVWYGGGKARAPMLETSPRSKKEAWRADLRHIKSLGFNTIRCWMDWASGEPAEKQYHFDTLDVLLELAEQEEMKVVLQVYMDSAPSWVGRKHPDSLFVSSNGQRIQPESSPGYCMDHPGVRSADLAFYKALAERARRSPAFVGWDLWSEPHVINWATPTYISNPEFCFCPNTVKRFRLWLQKKYPSIEDLNRAWYRSYNSWDEVEPNRLSTILSYTDFIDWKTFIADKLAEDLRARYDAVKSVAPQHIVTSHAAGVGLFSSPLWWEGQSDDWDMAKQVDYYGTSFYPKHSASVDRDVPWRGALLDFTRSFGYSGQGRGFYIGELQGGFGTIALSVSPTVTTEDLRIWTWSALSRGAKGICYYAWYPMSSGYESGGFGLIQLDGTITARSRAAGAIARVVDRNQKLFLDARPARAQAAVIYNPLVHFVGGRQREAIYGGPQGEAGGIEQASLLGIYRALFPTNVPIDFVHINELAGGAAKKYKLIYLPYPLMIPEAAAAALTEYVRAGGVLVAEARAGWNNERGWASGTIPGLGLHRALSCRETAAQTVRRPGLVWASDEIPGLKSGDRMPGRLFEETLEPVLPSGRVAARFASGAPAAVIGSFGRGKTLTLGSYLSAAYESGADATLQRFFAGVLEWAGVERPSEVTGAEAEVRLLESGAERLVFVFNHQEQPADVTVALRLPDADYKATDLVTGQPVALAAPLKMSGRIPAKDVWVVRLSPR